MTELEWLKQESGLDDAELKAMEAVAGHTKFVGMLQKLIGAQENSKSELSRAEQERLNLENRYQNEFIPEMRKVTQDALKAEGEAARMRAELAKAREYGIVPEGIEEQRAPGSPSPAAVATPATGEWASKSDMSKFQSEAGTALATMNDLNAEHFKLYGTPVPNMSELLTEVQRERTLGRSTNIRQVWESKHNVSAKRAEIAAADQKKHDDSIRESAIKEHVQKNGQNPMLRSPNGNSRFSQYDPSSSSSETKPWQKPNGMKNAANKPWRDASAQKLVAAGMR